MNADTTLPPALFELEQPVEDRPWEHAVRAHVIHSPNLDRRYYCAADQYGYLPDAPARHDAWVWHCCTQPASHTSAHVCDRCAHTWDGAPTHQLSNLPRSER